MQLAPYHGHERVDHSMLWTEGRDLDGGSREVRVLWDTSNTLNALNGHLFDGTVIGIYSSEPWAKNAIWRMAPVEYVQPPAGDNDDTV